MKDIHPYYLSTGMNYREYPQLIGRIIDSFRPQAICDVGGGAIPSLPLEYLQNKDIVYTVLDISGEELKKTPAGYQKIQQDIGAEDFSIQDSFDLVLTRMMAEHVRNGRVFHRNVFAMLKPGGIAVHYFPTLYSLPFTFNKITPNWLSPLFLRVFSRRDRNLRRKFIAFYSWCFGPIPPMIKMLKESGFEIIEFRGLYGHRYFDRISILRELHHVFSKFLIEHPNPYLTSYAQIVLKKPVAEG